MTGTELYQSVLRKLSHLPQTYLEDIDKYLSGLMKKVNQPTSANNTAIILSFAGSWSDMKDEEFDDFLIETRNIRTNLFDRNIDL